MTLGSGGELVGFELWEKRRSIRSAVVEEGAVGEEGAVEKRREEIAEEKNGGKAGKRTLRLMFFSLPSPFSFSSNTPKLAVLCLLVLSSFTSCRFLASFSPALLAFCLTCAAALEAARCRFCSRCDSFLSLWFLRSVRAAAAGSKLGSTEKSGREYEEGRKGKEGRRDEPALLGTS